MATKRCKLFYFAKLKACLIFEFVSRLFRFNKSLIVVQLLNGASPINFNQGTKVH